MSQEEKAGDSLRRADPEVGPQEWARRRLRLRESIPGKAAIIHCDGPEGPVPESRWVNAVGRSILAASVMLALAATWFIQRDPKRDPGLAAPVLSSGPAVAPWLEAGAWVGAVPRILASSASAADPGAFLSLCRERIETAARKRIHRTVEEVKTSVGMASGSDPLSF